MSQNRKTSSPNIIKKKFPIIISHIIYIRFPLSNKNRNSCSKKSSAFPQIPNANRLAAAAAGSSLTKKTPEILPFQNGNGNTHLHPGSRLGTTSVVVFTKCSMSFLSCHLNRVKKIFTRRLFRPAARRPDGYLTEYKTKSCKRERERERERVTNSTAPESVTLRISRCPFALGRCKINTLPPTRCLLICQFI